MSAKIIDGRNLSDEILVNLEASVSNFLEKPILSVIQIGDNPASTSYIKQKQKAADKIGASLNHIQLYDDCLPVTLKQQIEIQNDEETDGIIIQRPVPKHLQIPEILNSVNPQKDIDGFLEDSPFLPPIALAVIEMLKKTVEINDQEKFIKYLNTKDILIIGVGETAGGPIHKAFNKLNITHTTIDKSTPEEKRFFFIKHADILVSCVGIPNLIIGDMIKEGAICIGVGISRENDKLVGDFEEASIIEKASFYSPTPGGTGPVNVAFLMKNLVEAAKMQQS